MTTRCCRPRESTTCWWRAASRFGTAESPATGPAECSSPAEPVATRPVALVGALSGRIEALDDAPRAEVLHVLGEFARGDRSPAGPHVGSGHGEAERVRPPRLPRRRGRCVEHA